MNCETLETLWQAWLDEPNGPSPALNPAAEAHRAACEACRMRSAGYVALSTALKGSTHVQLPGPSAGFPDRVLWNWHTELRAEAGRRAWRRWGTLAAAAVLVVSSGLGFWIGRSGHSDRPSKLVVRQPSREPARLTQALAEATSATIELALESSAPAARLGRDVLGSTARVQAPSADLADPGGASNALEGAGRRLSSGVSPLSNQAQRAFGFLLGPAAAWGDPEPSARDGA